APVIPLKNIKGINTAQVVKTELSKGLNTSPVAFTQASDSGNPCSLYWVMLSITIMALSIISPTPRINPDRDMMLMEICSTWKKSKQTTMDTGTLMPINTGDFKSLKNKNITKKAKEIPHSKLCP